MREDWLVWLVRSSLTGFGCLVIPGDSDNRGFFADGPGPGLPLVDPAAANACLAAEGGRPRGRLNGTELSPDAAAAAAAAKAFFPVVPDRVVR